MRDGPIRRGLKAAARWIWQGDLWIYRCVARMRGEPAYRLEGSCEGCGRCCEEPTMRVYWLVFYLLPIRRLFLAWQRRVNGFELVGTERKSRSFAFRCTHYDPATKLCDSYESRPGMCRDYPRGLLYQPWPELFEECSYRLVSERGDAMKRALDEVDLDDEARAALEEKLRLK